MANADIQLLFGVLGDGSLSGESGSLIQEQLTQIVSALNKNPLKVKVALDTEAGGQKSWSSQVQTKLNTLSTNGKFSVQISKLDIGTGAISDFKKQLNAVINTLNLDKGTSITLSAEGIGEVKRQVKDAGDSANEAARKTAAFRVQLEALSGQKSAVQKALGTLGNSVATDEERARLAQLTTQYEQWAIKIETVRASKVAASSETQAELMAEGNAIKENISALMNAATAATEAANAEQAAAQGTAEAETARMATLNEVVSAYKKINDYINKNPRIANTGQHAELVSMRNELEAIWKSSAKAEDGLSGISKTDLRNILRRFSELDISLGEAGKKGRTLVGVIESAYKKFGGWMLVTRSLMAAVRGIKDMVSNVTALDSAMTELRKVTDATEIAYNQFFDTASVRAKKLGATFVDTISASADFARLGYSITEASDLADAALVYKNVGDGIQDVGEASESIISTMKAFEVEATNAMNIVDKFNEVGNNFAISSKGVGDALMRSAAALHAAGNSLDESIALVTAANNVVQNPEKVGNTLKTVSMFLRAAKTEAEEAGESTDGMANSVSELRKELLSLTGGKLDIQTDEDTFKSTYQIIKELSAVWGNLTDITQANILELIGGKRNSNVVAALITNFESAEAVLATAADSAGSALAENEKVLESIVGKISVYKAAFEDLSATFIDSGFVKGVVDFGTSTVEILTVITDKLGSMPALIAAITGAITVYSSVKNKTNFGIFDVVDGNKIGVSSPWIDTKKNIAEYNSLLGSSVQTQEIFTQFLGQSDQTLADYVKSLNGSKATMSGFKNYCKQSGVAVSAFGASSKAAAVGVTAMNVAMNMLISLGIALLIQGIVAGFNAIVNAASIASDKANELADSTREQAKASKEDVDALDALVERYKYLRQSELTDSETRIEIRNIQDEIVNLVGAEAGGIDLVNGKLDDTLDKLREKQRIQAEDMLDSSKAAYNAAVDAEDKAVASSKGSFTNPAFGEWAFVGDRDKRAEDILRNAGYGRNVQSAGWFNNTTYVTDYWNNDGTMVQGAAQKVEVLRGMVAALKEAGDTDSDVFTKLQQQYEAYDEYTKKTSEAAKGLLDATYTTEKYSDSLDNMTVDSVDTYNAYRDGLIEAIKNNEILKSAIEAGDISNDDITTYVDDVMAKNYSTIFDKLNGGQDIKALSNALKTLTSDTDSLRTAMNALSTSPADFDKLFAGEDGQKYMSSLLSSFPQLRDELQAYNDGIITSTELQLAMNEAIANFNADKLGAQIKNVVDATQEYGDGSFKVTQAIQEMDAVLPGISNLLLNKETALRAVEAGAYDSAEAMIDFVRAEYAARTASSQADYESLVKEYGDVTNAALTAAAAVWMKNKADEATANRILDLMSESDRKYEPKSSKSKDKDPQLEAFEKEVERLDHLRAMDTIDEDTYLQNKLAALQTYLKDREKYQKQWWAWEEEFHNRLKELKEEEIDDLKDRMDKEIDANEEYYRNLKQQKEKEYEAEKDRVDKVIDQLDKELDAKKKAIQKQKDMLTEQSDNRDYEKTVAEKNKEIANIRAQLTNLDLDDSAEAKAKKIALQEELTKALADLEDYQYDHSIEAQHNALDTEETYWEDHFGKLIEEQEAYLENLKNLYDQAIESIESSMEAMSNSIKANFEAMIASIQAQIDNAGSLPGMAEISPIGGGGDATSLQQMLTNAGYGGYLGNTGVNGDGIDGKVGSKTIKALQAFLQASVKPDLKIDGIIGPKTKAAIEEAIRRGVLSHNYGLYHSGGVVGKNFTNADKEVLGALIPLNRNEVMSRLLKGEVVANEGQQKMIRQAFLSAASMSPLGNIKSGMSKTLTGVSTVNNAPNITFDMPITIGNADAAGIAALQRQLDRFREDVIDDIYKSMSGHTNKTGRSNISGRH